MYKISNYQYKGIFILVQAVNAISALRDAFKVMGNDFPLFLNSEEEHLGRFVTSSGLFIVEKIK